MNWQVTISPEALQIIRSWGLDRGTYLEILNRLRLDLPRNPDAHPTLRLVGNRYACIFNIGNTGFAFAVTRDDVTKTLTVDHPRIVPG